MCHTFLVVTVKRWLKSVYICGSYRKIKTGVPLFWTTLYIAKLDVKVYDVHYLFVLAYILVYSSDKL